MSFHLRLIEIEMYLPYVSSAASLHKALGALGQRCKHQPNLALTIEPFYSCLLYTSDAADE